jgi:hypothetical protein
MASTISTPGITGKSGKWPGKNGSLWVTFLMPTIALGFQFDDAIHQQNGIPVRQDVPDFVDIQNGHGVSIITAVDPILRQVKSVTRRDVA